MIIIIIIKRSRKSTVITTGLEKIDYDILLYFVFFPNKKNKEAENFELFCTAPPPPDPI